MYLSCIYVFVPMCIYVIVRVFIWFYLYAHVYRDVPAEHVSMDQESEKTI